MRIIAIDGPSGSGKTSLATFLREKLADVAVVPMDHLYPGWEGLAQAPGRLVDCVLRPLRAGRQASYHQWDWSRSRWGSRVVVPSGGVLVVEGVGSGATVCAPYLDALVYVDAEPAVRRQRAITRDGAVFAPHWERWAEQEVEHFAAERTKDRADFVIQT